MCQAHAIYRSGGRPRPPYICTGIFQMPSRSLPRYRYLYFVMALPSLCNCATEPLLLCDWAFIAVFSGSSGICFSILSTTICHPMLGTRRPLSQYKGCYEPAFKPQQPCRRFSLLAHWRWGWQIPWHIEGLQRRSDSHYAIENQIDI